MNESLQKLVHTFFEKLGLTITSLTIEQVTDDVNIRIETPDSALVIGMHGKSLDSFMHILSRMIEKITTRHLHIHLEVNDYVKTKDERFFRFLDSKISFVTSTGKSSRIENLTSFERKKAHQYISERSVSGLSTHSDGEGTSRALILEFTGTIATPPSTPPTQKHTITQQTSAHTLSEDGVGI